MGEAAGLAGELGGCIALVSESLSKERRGYGTALVATVAGLAVAIPCLFGYNYLASRIKNLSADMQIFVDEFITRVAEEYGAR